MKFNGTRRRQPKACRDETISTANQTSPKLDDPVDIDPSHPLPILEDRFRDAMSGNRGPITGTESWKSCSQPLILSNAANLRQIETTAMDSR